MQQYGKPAIVLSIESNRAKGSARSIGNVDIHELIKAQGEHLEKFGGHKMAAGLSMRTDAVEPFRRAINEAAKSLHSDDFLPTESILGELESGAIDFELLDILESFEPYGEGNPRPRFLVKDAEIVGIKRFGSDRSHSRLNLRFFAHERQTHEILAFRQIIDLLPKELITCSYTINKNEFNGRISLQMMLERIYHL